MSESSSLNKISEDRLDSWKEIASFLGRGVRTVQRWEKDEDLPIHRHRHSNLDSVYAFKKELNEWQKSRRRGSSVLELPVLSVPEVIESAPTPISEPHTLKIGALTVAVLAGVVLLGIFWFRSAPPGGKIHTDVMPVPLSTYLGEQESPALSPDGSKVAFVWNGEHRGNFDIYVKNADSSQAKQLTHSSDISYSPAWSPDSKWIAFCSGTQERDSGLWMVSASGETTYKVASLYHGGASPSERVLSWSPDGKFLVVSQRRRESENNSLYRLNLKTGEKRRLTDPKPGESDYAPAVSPDGKWIAFSRDTGRGVSAVYLLSFDTGQGNRAQPRLLSWHGFNQVYAGDPAWTPDSQYVVFDSNNGGNNYLWIASINRPEITSLPYGYGITSPSISLTGQLAFVHGTLEVNIWKLEPRELMRGRNAAPVQVVSSTRVQQSPSVSPNGKRLAFASDRSGYLEIWTSSIESSNAAPLTDMRVPVTGSPSWSPDGKSIAYDSRVNARPQIFVISANGGRPVALTDGSQVDDLPSFSPDGKWIYFSSERSGEQQIWKMRLTGADAQQVTEKGGFAGMFSPDGEYLYYNRANGPFSSLWRRRLSTGEERCIDSMIPERAFAPANDGVFYRSVGPDQKQCLMFLSLRSNKAEKLFTFQKPAEIGMALSPDSRSLFFAQEDQRSWDLELVQGFWH